MFFGGFGSGSIVIQSRAIFLYINSYRLKLNHSLLTKYFLNLNLNIEITALK